MNRHEKKSGKKRKSNVVYMKGSEAAGRNNQERRNQRNRQRTLLAAALLVLAAVAGVCIYHVLNRSYKGYKIVNSAGTSYENTAGYVQYNGNLLKYTPDGVSYINGNGDVVWSAGINMSMPIVETNGKYAVVADMSGNSVCVFNDEGQVSSLTMPYSICDVDVGKQGAFVVVLESDKTNFIQMYDKTGTLIYEMKTTIDKSGYPLDVTISDNAEKLITSYINISGTSIENNVAAYNFGSVGQNSNVDRVVGGYLFEDEVVPKVEFVDNNTVVAFGTKTINIYKMKEKPSKKAVVTLQDEAQSIFYCENYFGYIQKSDNDEHLYELKLYNMSGKLKLTRYIDFEYDNVYAADKEVIVTGGDNCIIMRSNGTCKYDGKLSGKIVSMVPSGNRLEYVVVYENRTETIKLKAEEQDNSGETDDASTAVSETVTTADSSEAAETTETTASTEDTEEVDDENSENADDEDLDDTDDENSDGDDYSDDGYSDDYLDDEAGSDTDAY